MSNFEYRRNPNYKGTPSNTTGPGDPVWEKQTREWVRNALDNFPTKKLNEADIGALRDKTFATHGLRLDRPADVLYVADKMLIAWEFSSVRAALERAKQKAPEYDANGLAAHKLIFDAAYSTDLDLANDDDLVATILFLGHRNQLPVSELGKQEKRQAEDVAREQLEKDRLIAGIARGKPTYPSWNPEWKTSGRTIAKDSTSLASKEIDELVQIAAEVSEIRRTRNLTREEQRAELRQATEARGYKVYRPSDDHAISVVTSNRPTTVADRGTGVSTNSGSLINKQTGQEYTRAELGAVARNDIELWRSLMRRNLTRFNEILANKGE